MLAKDDYGNDIWVVGPSDTPSEADIAAFANLGYTPAEVTDFLKGMSEVQATEGAGVAGSAGGSWAVPSSSIWSIAKQLIPSDTQGQAKLAAGLMGALGGALTGSATPQRVGYQGSIPQYTAVRQAVPGTYDPNRRPGSGGQRYFTDTQYIPTSNAEGIAAAQLAATQQADRLAAANAANAARQTLPPPKAAAHGGLMNLARGRYLQGSTDGMADKLDASIDGREPAKLSHGEFVVPADVVSHLGNGNSDAGAKKLYQMMDKIRMARTGTKKQGKQINPDKYMPGGSVGYAEGGPVHHFVAGGTATTGFESNLSNWAGPYVTEMLGRGAAAAAKPYEAYMGPLTAGTSALQDKAFTGYGNLATPAGIGTAATTAGGLATKMQGLNYTPTTITNTYAAPTNYQAGTFATDTFGAPQAQQYMNPYLQAALDPQIAEARRQAQISNLQNMSKLTQAGAYGGGRQAIIQAESDRNLAQNLANITGQGYNTAYQNAMAQFNQDQARKQQAQQLAEQSRQFGYGQQANAAQLAAQYGLTAQQAQEAAKQFGAQYGLQGLQGALQATQAQGSLAAQQNQLDLANLAAQMQAGTAQRGITAEGIAADKAQAEEEKNYDLKMAQYMASLLPNLPLATQGSQTTTTNTAQNAAGGAASTIELLKTLGVLKTA